MIDFVQSYGPRVITALLLLVIGRWLIGYAQRLIDRSFRKAKMDVSMRKFLESLISIALKIGLIIAIAGFLGFKSTSLIAILGAAGLAVGLALQ
ncbi:MAG: hypothetical protein H6766_07515 [Candidatus Peribacteria bacterium]|nr:MAG: hypothetical protein H6766_07515 [Candidatus Peribacteria bacterium]